VIWFWLISGTVLLSLSGCGSYRGQAEKDRTPGCYGPDEWAIEYHAPDALHINVHPFCLHMWRPQHQEIPVPSAVMV